MTKLSIMFAVIATATLLGGCPKKKEGETKDQPATKTTDTTVAPTPTPTPDPAKAADPKVETPVAAADLPAECGEYKAAIDKLATCEKMPQQSRDSLKQAYEASAKSWAAVTTPEGKTQLATSCKQGADALKQAAATTCGW